MEKLPNIIDDVFKLYAKKAKRYPCHVNRASSIGYFVPALNGCIRKGVYERTKWAEKKLYEPATLMIFEEGNRQELNVQKDLLDAGWEIIEAQTPFECTGKDGELLCTGHIDGKIMFKIDGERVPVPIEIKSMHPNIYTGMKSFEDFQKKPWTRAYIAQIQLYMLMSNSELALFILKNKSSGKMKTIEVYLDYELAEECLKVCEEINNHVKNNTLPDRIDDRDTCADCLFNHVCLPDFDFGTEIEIGDDPSFEDKIRKYMSMVETKREAEKMYKETISPRMKATAKDGELNLLLGDYHLTGKTDKKGSFRPKITLLSEEND